MAHVDFLSAEIKKRYGAVTRARGYFLYTRKGVRLVDMYQEGGRAILGWGGTPFTVFKNILNRGLTGSFYTDYHERVAKATQDLLGWRCAVFVFGDKAAALKAALNFSKNGTSFYKPWRKPYGETAAATGDAGDASSGACHSDCVIIEPPLPWTQQIFLLAVRQEVYEVYLASGGGAGETAGGGVCGSVGGGVCGSVGGGSGKIGVEIPGSVKIPAPLAAAAARAIYDLISEIPNRGEKGWFRYDKIVTRYWHREGAYLFPKVCEGDYENFVCHCLDCGIVISPDYNTPSIIPYGVDEGVFANLKKKQFEYGGSDDRR